MCGITAYFGFRKAGEVLFDSLKRLEYRGYDSAGIATLSNPEMQIKKDEGEIDEIDQKLNFGEMGGNTGIGHTRWASHGDVSKENAHPHTSCEERFAIVHNGIIENWEALKAELEGHEFTSETDSEVIAHFVEERVDERGVEGAIREFLKEAEGSFAVVILDSREEEMYAFKRGSPLTLGIGEDEMFLASDIYAFSPYTDEAIFLEDGEYVILEGENYVIKDRIGNVKDREPRKFEWEDWEKEDEEFEYHMRKEIEEIPKAIERLEKSLENTQGEDFDNFLEKMKEHDKVLFTASGTSYHASLLGVYFLNKTGIDAQTLIASEFKNYERVDEDTLVVAISQSGETKDVMDAVEFSKERGAEIASIVNVPHSSLERESDVSLRIKAGQEICVAATKTFTNQLYMLLKLGKELGYTGNISDISEELKEVIERNEERVKELSKEIKDNNDVYIIGRGETYPVAREIALKLKEIPYVHAEGMMGGELKHGTLALVEEGTPVISLIPEKNSEIKSNVKEAEARGAKSIRISPWEGEFEIPTSSNGKFAFYSTVIGFLLAYWIARRRDLPIDRPRNLAKSVTVR